MIQHVNEATHRSGHALDLVLTREQDNIMPDVTVRDECFPDHHPVFCELPLQSPRSKSHEITYRRIKAIQIDSFTSDITASELCSIPSDTQSESAIRLYNSVLSSIIDRHAPEKTRCVPIRSQPDWYTAQVREAKQKRRQCLWRKTKLTVHRDMYRDMTWNVNILIDQTKSSHLHNIISENSGDSRKCSL